MEWSEALPLLQENHTGVAISVTPKGRAQATVVSTAVLDGKVGFASRDTPSRLKTSNGQVERLSQSSSSTPGATSPSRALRPSSLGKTQKRTSNV